MPPHHGVYNRVGVDFTMTVVTRFIEPLHAPSRRRGRQARLDCTARGAALGIATDKLLAHQVLSLSNRGQTMQL